ncbi:hypothetical protein POL68_21185 [Stigmatella sp. ncwal1]|uniref:Uncharacterized protein n=1 Tax=Stigmatella ashevillensis TaxID=2995309 RepID=A0ABT5DBE4_9BACT|nr:hypothetical protein [Stigmatella ashevillena]MDC0711000.1 hypothetical protein [Stigmatella ashevillena]
MAQKTFAKVVRWTGYGALGLGAVEVLLLLLAGVGHLLQEHIPYLEDGMQFAAAVVAPVLALWVVLLITLAAAGWLGGVLRPAWADSIFRKTTLWGLGALAFCAGCMYLALDMFRGAFAMH